MQQTSWTNNQQIHKKHMKTKIKLKTFLYLYTYTFNPVDEHDKLNSIY